jgi:hypothetical protein
VKYPVELVAGTEHCASAVGLRYGRGGRAAWVDSVGEEARLENELAAFPANSESVVALRDERPLIAGRAMGLSPTSLASEGKAPSALRTILDKPYDISTFLREPLGWKRLGAGVGAQMPRRKMLDRYEDLMAHIERRRYERIVFVSHSQGTILTTTLLAEDGIRLPPEVSLMTFGCPLRQLYLKRFPSQYGWVERLRDPSHRTEFVKQVNREWVNVAAAGDPIGRTVFGAPPEPWNSPTPPLPAGSPKLVELLLGAGGHSSYWTAPDLYKELERLIDST